MNSAKLVMRCLAVALAGSVLLAGPGPAVHALGGGKARLSREPRPAAGEPGRGTDGTLRLNYWQEVSTLNPYLAAGSPDLHAASLILEPLLEYNPDGELVPVLAQEVPTLGNGGVAVDLRSITYQLLPGVLWADGAPLTADDFVFTWQYCSALANSACTDRFNAVQNVEALDPLTLKIIFAQPQTYPYIAFAGQRSPVLQKAQFASCLEDARACTAANQGPVGTGPYRMKEFRANDRVHFAINPYYRKADKPYFAEVIIEGSEDAWAAAKAVFVNGTADYAWNLQVAPASLDSLAANGRGKLVSVLGAQVERIAVNFTNPDPDLGSKRSEWTEADPNPHPFLSDPVVRQALSLAIDRTAIARLLYGAAGKPTCNIVAGPRAYVSTRNDLCLVQDIEGAKALLEGAGWVDSNGDGVREKNGVELRVLYQTAVNSVRQATQSLVAGWWGEIGVATELKAVDAAGFFGGDQASPDTMEKFYADVEMFANGGGPNPEAYLGGWRCRVGGTINIPNNQNEWTGSNIERWCSQEFDTLWGQLAATADPAARASLVKELNDLLVQTHVALPLVERGTVSAHSVMLLGVQPNGYDTHLWNTEDWLRLRLKNALHLPLVAGE